MNSFLQAATNQVKRKEKKEDFSSIEWYHTIEAFLSDVLIIDIQSVTWRSLIRHDIIKIDS